MKATTCCGDCANCFQYSFFGEVVDVGAELAGVCSLIQRTRTIVVGLDEFQERLERDLGINDDLPASGNMDDHVGAQATLVGGGRDLLVEVAVRDHARHLHHPAELHFAPTTSRLWRTESRHEIARLLLQQFVAEMQLRHFLAQSLVRAPALHLYFLQSPLVAGQCLTQRAQQLGDGLLALGEIPLRRGLHLAELRLGQGEELLVVLLQRLGGQLGKGTDQLLTVLVCP